MFLIDTNVISELRKVESGRADSQVQRWVTSVPPNSLYLSVISILELERGVLRTERRDSRQALGLRAWLEEGVMRPFAERILPVTPAIARRCAALHVPDHRPAHDALIAATALVHNMPVVTRNISDYAPMDVELINPWTYQA